MTLLLALFYGAATGVVAVLIHQTLPPFGVIAALAFTYSAIWWVGRHFGSRISKVIAAVGWIAVLLRAGTFGVGRELLVQGDGVGSTLLLIGTLVALTAVAARL
jgi:hypothetical protein